MPNLCSSIQVVYTEPEFLMLVSGNCLCSAVLRILQVSGQDTPEPVQVPGEVDLLVPEVLEATCLSAWGVSGTSEKPGSRASG